MNKIYKRIASIVCVCACLMCSIGVLFHCGKNITVASAQVYDSSTSTFCIGLPTYNSLVYTSLGDEYFTTPLVAIVGNRSLMIAPSKDGFTPSSIDYNDYISIPINSEDNFVLTQHYSQGGVGAQTENVEIVVVAYRNSFNEIPQGYLPYKMYAHYVFNNSVGLGEMIYCEYYIDYVNPSNAEQVVRGAGFSLRVSCDEHYNMRSNYFQYFGTGSPSNRYNVIDTADVLGWSYSSIGGLLGSYQAGYDDGYRNGESVGYARGYGEGVSQAGDSSFRGLISAVVDVPINAFKSLFDFNILGFNMSQFMLSMLTMGAVLAIVRLIL